MIPKKRGPKPQCIDKEVLLECREQGLRTSTQIARKLGYGIGIVCREMKRHGIPFVPRGRHRITLPQTALRKCVQRGLRYVGEIARELGHSDGVISCEMRRHGLPIIRGGRRCDLSRPFLVREFCVLGKSLEDIATQTGFARCTIRQKCKELGIHIPGRAGGQNKSKLAGKRIGRLKVRRECGRVERHVVWECRCKCGNLTYATSSMLNAGYKRSCGCLKNKRDKGGQ